MKKATTKATLYFIPMRIKGVILIYLFTITTFYANAQAPVITSFTPTSGAVGTAVTITGTGFNTTPANNIVFFGATRASVSSSSATSLTVNVPMGANYAPLTLLNTGNSLAAYSKQFFNLTFSPSVEHIATADIATKVDFGTGANPTSAAISDIDGDSKPDLVIVNSNNIVGNSVSILLNTGSPGVFSFAQKVNFVTGTNPISMDIGDIDGDGKLDLAVTNYNSSSVSVLLNTSSIGNINFTSKFDFTIGSNPNSVAIGDLDGDGKPDLAITNQTSNSISVLRNTGIKGTISFASKVDFTTGNGPSSVVIGDIDGDNKPDLSAVNNSSNTVSVLRNMSSIGIFSFSPKVDFATGLQPNSICIGDLDFDGKLDLVTVNSGSNTISIFHNDGSNGTISFATKVDFGTSTNPNSVAIGDIDGDGKPDLAIANISSNMVSVLRNISINSNINFASKIDFATGSNPGSVAIGDIDGDGKPDLTTANNSSYTVSILRNNPQIIPNISSFTPTSGEVGTIITIIGNNFNPTLTNNIVFFGTIRATVNSATSTNLNVTLPAGAPLAPITVLNTTNGLAAYSNKFFNPTFSPNKGNITTADIAAKVDSTTGTNPISIAIGDIDGDGKPDMAIANYSSNTVSVITNLSTPGTLSFLSKVDFATGTNPLSIALGDIDGDGKLDITTANSTSNNVSVLRNTSTPSKLGFATRVDIASGINTFNVVIADIDGDGKQDLVTSNSNSVSVFRNAGTPGTVSFAPKVDIAKGTSLAVADLDGDYKLDISIANRSSNTISVFRNTSSPGVLSFGLKVDLTSGTSPVSLAIGDIDGDGKLDIATANSTSNNVSVLRNSSTVGALSFATKLDFNTNGAAYSLAIGDINGDDKPDLAIADVDSNTVSVLCNTSTIGSPNFFSKVDFSTGDASQPQSIAIGDMDGDGKSDVAAVNYKRNTVSVLRNNPQITPSPKPTIKSIFPTNGEVGTTVNITGNLFNSTPSNNIVFFGATRAIVNAATDTSLIVKVPSGATFAPISLINTSNSLAAYSTQFFTPTFSPNKGNITPNDFAAKINFATGKNPFRTAIADIDGDGKSDLVIANYNFVSVLRNIGTSGLINFESKIDFATGIIPSSIAVGDIDGDGKPDLVLSDDGNYVSVLRNMSTLGAIGFASKLNFGTGESIRSIAIGDLDGDGKLDLATANWNGYNVSVLRNISSPGSINFIQKIDYGTGSRPYSVAIGDIDGDGKQDLAVANNGSGTVSILNNNGGSGTISFAKKIDVIVGAYPISLSIGDMDGDNKLDLVVAYSSINSFSVSRNISNIGTINFAKNLYFSMGTDATSVAISDLDGDGKPDVAVSNYIGQNIVSVARNTGTLATVNFEPKVNLGAIFYNSTIAIGDLDGDGKPDMAITNFDSSSVSILRNNPRYSGSINVTGSLNSFSTCSGSASAQQNFSVSAAGLSADLVITAPIGFEISTTSGFGFDNTITLQQTSGSIVTTNIYVRLIGSSNGTPNGNIVCSSTGAASKNLTVNGLVKSSPNTSNISGLANVSSFDTVSYSVTGTGGSVYNWSLTKGTIQSGVGTNQIQIKWNAIGSDTLKVVETNNQGCIGVQKKLVIKVSPNSSISEINESSNIIIYPNPANDRLSIKNNSGQAQLNFNITDLFGRELILGNMNQTLESIDISKLPKGIYLIRFPDFNMTGIKMVKE